LSLLAAGGALLSLFSLPATLACFGILGWLALRKRGWIDFVGAAAVSAALFVAISYPWALRNEAVLGEKVWTRSSFGFDFALGYHDKAISPSDELKVFSDRLDEVSPFLSPTGLASLKEAGGEIAYNRLSIACTEEWIGQHPAGALKIAARHVREFYFPSRWMFFSSGARMAAFKQATIWTIAFVGLARLGLRLARGDWRYVYVGAPPTSADAALRLAPADCSLPLLGRRTAHLPRRELGLPFNQVCVETALLAAALGRRGFGDASARVH
jgi:hypothetical protein